MFPAQSHSIPASRESSARACSSSSSSARSAGDAVALWHLALHQLCLQAGANKTLQGRCHVSDLSEENVGLKSHHPQIFITYCCPGFCFQAQAPKLYFNSEPTSTCSSSILGWVLNRCRLLLVWADQCSISAAIATVR